MKSSGLLLRTFILGIVVLMPVIALAQEAKDAGNNSNNSNNWSNDIVPNCQQAIRTQVTSRFNGSTVNFTGKPTKGPSGSNVIVNGRAQVRAFNRRSGDIHYDCSMRQDGSVVDSKFNVMSGNLTETAPVRR